MDTWGHVRPLQANKTLLLGSGADILITYVSDYGSQPLAVPWGLPSSLAYGSEGRSSGCGYIFSLDASRTWQEAIKLVAFDAAQGHLFGSSVAIKDETVVIGAPHAENRGDMEVQSIVCTADAGSFILRYKGASSKPIPFNDPDLEAHLESIATIKDVIVSAYTDLCRSVAPETITITFVDPEEGNLPALQADTSMLTLSGSPGSIVITDDVIRGTAVSSGEGATFSSAGAAYVFVRSGLQWNQQQKLVQPIAEAHSGAEFGYSCVLDTDLALIGSPRADVGGINKGKVYVFVRSGGVWTNSQQLSRIDAMTGSRFGHALSFSGITLIISGPGQMEGSGAIWIYKLNSGLFIFDQKLEPSTTIGLDISHLQNFGFGWSVTGFENTIVVGAPGK